jgi:hypothetical protein
MAAANTLNKQPWTNDKEWSSSLGVERGAQPLTIKINLLQNINMFIELGQSPWINDISDIIRSWYCGEYSGIRQEENGSR